MKGVPQRSQIKPNDAMPGYLVMPRRIPTIRTTRAAGVLINDAQNGIALDGGAMHDAVRRAVVVGGVMLGDAVVPKRHIAGLPAPANGEFRAA